MKRLLILLLWAIPCFATTYSTSFPATETPISEGGKWVNGGTTGLDWTNIDMLANTKAYGTSSGVSPGYDDSTAVLQGIAGWGRNQFASGIAYVNAGSIVDADDPEIEIRLNVTIAAHSITGYECNYSAHQSGGQYSSIVRWNGPTSNFTRIAGPNTSIPKLTNGDTLGCGNVGGTITSWIIHAGTYSVINTATDTTYTGGSPGIGTDLDNGGSGTNGAFGFSSFYASDFACPSGANYVNPANPTGSLVTLSSLGVTVGCYYISATTPSGGVAPSDSNTGTDELHPWLHAPGMANCSSNCAAVNFSQGTQLAGIGFIFHGGDTYHFGQNTGDYTGGVWEWNPSSGGPYGTASHPIYLGVDPGWYSGGAWARPIFTADNSLCNLGTTGTMPDGDTCTGSSDTGCFTSGQSFFGQPCYYVSACAYQISANGGASNDFFDLSNNTYIVIDNFEMTGLCQSGAGDINGKDTYVSYGSASTNGPPIYALNNYIHGASHVRYAGLNGSSSCNPTGVTICINLTAFYGSNYSSSGATGESIFFNVVDFSDSDPSGENLTLTGFYDVAYNVFRYTTQGLMNTLHVFHDNLIEYEYSNGHSNLMESKEVLTANAVYNNVARHLFTANTGDVVWWLGPQSGVTDYFFNNLTYDVGSSEYFNMGGTGLTTNPGNYTIFNNTFQSSASSGIWGCTSSPGGTFLSTNNHFITDAGSTSSCSVGTLTTLAPLLMTNATATTDGYTSSQTYAYSPTSSGSPTVGAGTNETSGYCATLLASGDNLIQAAGTACESDTTYSCSYNATSHTVSCPTRTVVGRPGSGAWDIGAYEFLAGASTVGAVTSGGVKISGGVTIK